MNATPTEIFEWITNLWNLIKISDHESAITSSTKWLDFLGLQYLAAAASTKNKQQLNRMKKSHPFPRLFPY